MKSRGTYFKMLKIEWDLMRAISRDGHLVWHEKLGAVTYIPLKKKLLELVILYQVYNFSSGKLVQKAPFMRFNLNNLYTRLSPHSTEIIEMILH